MANLHKEYLIESVSMKERPQVDKDIRKYINENISGNYEQILSKDERWDVFFHLTEMRRSILNWYDFKDNCELLEIGSGFGAITGLFCEKCKSVTAVERYLYRAEAICERYSEQDNLDVYVGRIEDMNFDKKFDYITIVGTLEYQGDGLSEKSKYVEYLKSVMRFLKKDGRILIAAENRYGIKYFCGEQEAFTGRPFEGINRYPRGTHAYAFSRQELINILDIAGIKKKKFYYPLPDYKLPQLIFSDEFLPKSSVRERVIPYYKSPKSLLAYENDIYDDLIENHVFEFFSNSFLVECGFESDFCPVIYSAVSTDRGPKDSYATSIYNNDLVAKKALYSDGSVGIQRVFDNMLRLKQQGVPIVPHNKKNDTLWMPYINNPTLSDYLRDISKEDHKEEFMEVFDKLYKYILQSSEHGTHANNDLVISEKELDLGPILKISYIDMIPINCFYSDGEYLFFDQEFTRENYPAKYTLFRALKYTYLFYNSAETCVPLKSMKERYDMVELWNIFDELENKFVFENRKQDVYKNFLEWSWIDRMQMYENAEYLRKNKV